LKEVTTEAVVRRIGMKEDWTMVVHKEQFGAIIYRLLYFSEGYPALFRPVESTVPLISFDHFGEGFGYYSIISDMSVKITSNAQERLEFLSQNGFRYI
jgi:hypothetical protein